MTPVPDMRRRSGQAELLDEGALSADDLAANLRDLARLNRLPGGARASERAIRALLGDGGGTVLDVGTGAADIPRAIARRLPGVTVTATDHDPAIVALAQRWTAGQERVSVTEADALALPFGDGAFDVAHASLVVHHLDPPEVVMLLRELDRVSLRGIVVNDLRRGWFPYAATVLTVRAFGRSPVTHHDGPLSVRRSYALRELDALAAEAGLQCAHRSLPVMPRVVTIYR